MSTATLERLPNTVTVCHAEIRKLREAVSDGSATEEIAALKETVSALESERDELKDKLEASEKTVSELEERVDELEDEARPNAVEAIERFLDECERVGPLRYDVPQSDRAMRAIITLHDAVGRNP
jgi:predicted RNase H-like nuclease (RuvC/YqgF family)